MNVNEDAVTGRSSRGKSEPETTVLIAEEVVVVEIEARSDGADHGHAHTVEILVNERPVQMEPGETTGLHVKKAAIAQGVPIEVDFVLSEELGGGRTKIVGDEDRVAIHPHAKFHAVAPDDNS